MRLDEHGQPADFWVNERLRVDRAIHEMLGVIKGVIGDGLVTADEAASLQAWFRANPDAVRVWPGKVLAARLNKIFVDGVIDDTERLDLQDLLEATVGITDEEAANPTTTLPFDTPPPPLTFPNRTFLFTGKFVYGTRDLCQRAVVDRGGQCVTRVNEKVDVLVVGCIGSRDWAHTSFGRKIEGVVKLKEKGLPVCIVGEQHWAVHLVSA
jgi:hypothetical protein